MKSFQLLTTVQNTKSLHLLSSMSKRSSRSSHFRNWNQQMFGRVITCVSLLFLYGTCGRSEDKAEITSPRALRDLLMELASCRGGEENLKRAKRKYWILLNQFLTYRQTFSWWSLAPVLAALSLPARSTRLSFPVLTLPLVRFLLSTMMPTIRWERELSTFISWETKRPRVDFGILIHVNCWCSAFLSNKHRCWLFP